MHMPARPIAALAAMTSESQLPCRLHQSPKELPRLARRLNPDATLIPVPRSAPFSPKAKSPAHWAPLRICEALKENGLARDVLPCLKRIKAVKKSAYSQKGERPVAKDHYHTVAVELAKRFKAPTAITLVDDFLTLGATFVGLVTKLKESFPDVPIRCFALVLSVSDEIEALTMPVCGSIRFDGYFTQRRP